MASIELKLVPWQTPNFATVSAPPRPRQEGMQKLQSIPLAELSDDALTGLAEDWLYELYKKAGKPCNWRFD